MPLKQFVDRLEDVPEAVRSLYAPTSDGKRFVLQLEGGWKDPETEARIKEFRENNIRLLREQEQLKQALAPFEGLDAETVQKIRQAEDQFKAEEEKALIKQGKWDELVARRTAAARAEMEAQVKAAQKALQEKEQSIGVLTGRLASLTVDTEVRRALEAAGLKPRTGALDDIIRRARETWRINEKGEMQPVDAEGKIRYGADTNPLSMKEYVTKELATQAQHLFEPAEGGGAAGGSKGATPTGGTIDGTDPVSFGRNIEKIAKGEVKVVAPQ